MPKKDINDLIRGDKTLLSLSLIMTKNCNLRCIYCYEKHNLRDNKKLDFFVAKKNITKYMSKDEYDGVEIEFFGGEPMLAFPLIRDIVDWFHSQKFNKDHRFLIGTNGTIINDDIKNWLYKNKRCVSVALSLDGNKTAHDISRDNSYDIVHRNLSFFKENWPNQPAKMTICAETIPYVAESVIYLEEMGLLFSANIGFEDIWGTNERKKNLLEIYERQLSILVDYYAERPHLYPVSPILTSVPEYLGFPDSGESKKKDNTRFCGAGHAMVVVDVDGSSYPCHRFLPWITGKPAPLHKVNCQSAWKPDKCAQCKLILSCPTCAGFNWEINGDDGFRTTFHCDSYKLEVLASCKLEAIRLNQRYKDFDKLSFKEKQHFINRLEAIWDLIENGI